MLPNSLSADELKEIMSISEQIESGYPTELEKIRDTIYGVLNKYRHKEYVIPCDENVIKSRLALMVAVERVVAKEDHYNWDSTKTKK